MTYKELENLFGENLDGTPCGIARGSISRGITDLLAKGFIEIVRQGGAYQKDKTIYGLSDDWQFWHRGLVIRERKRGNGAGYQALKKQGGKPIQHTYKNEDELPWKTA